MGGEDNRKVVFWEGESMTEHAGPTPVRHAGQTAGPNALRHEPPLLLIHEILDSLSKNCYDADGFSR